MSPGWTAARTSEKIGRLSSVSCAAAVAVFDAGIGSCAAVATLRRLLPRQDIVYLADRASLPYGDKSREDLLAILRRTLRFLDGFAPTAVLVASNAPSITVLDDLAGLIAAPVVGVRLVQHRALVPDRPVAGQRSSVAVFVE